MVIFFLIILSLTIIIATLIILSTLRIDIKEFMLINKKIENIKIEISLNLFNKFKWIKLTIDNQKIRKIQNNQKFKSFNKILDKKLLRKNIKIRDIIKNDYKQITQEFNNIKLEKINLKADISTKDIKATAFIVTILSSILAITLAKKINNPKFEIRPTYLEKNYIYLSINCIFSIKLVHIINIYKKLERKGVHQKYGRTSNRRTYANSNG